MNDYCKQYIREIRFLFPSFSRPEKQYLSRLKESIQEYIEESDCNSKEELYHTFGKPEEVIMSYYNNMDLSEITKKIRLSHYIKKALSILLVLVLLGVTTWGVYTYHSYKILKEERIFFENTTIE